MRLRNKSGIQDNSEINKIDNNNDDKSILINEYESTSETGHTDQPRKLKPEMKLISTTLGKKKTVAKPVKENYKGKKDKDEKFLQPESEIIPERTPITDLNSLEKASDGVIVFPIKLGCYEHIFLNGDETKITSKIGVKSYFQNPDHTVSPCLIVK